MKKTYPIIIYSDEIFQILCTFKEPQKKEIKTSKYVLLLISLSFLAYFISSAIKVYEYGSIWGGIFFSLLSIICFLLFIFSLTYIVFNSTIFYRIRYKKWENTIRKLETNKSQRIVRKNKVQQALSDRNPAECETYEKFENVKRGLSDLWFYNKLKNDIEDIGGSISLNKKIMIFNYSHLRYDLKSIKKELDNTKFYYPDIAISINNLNIDIEIDEPYVLDSGEPIHCIGTDDYRNKYIAANGWEIIRFSEQQIVEHSDKCIKTIKNVIESILDGNGYNVIPAANDDWITPCWTESMARQMSEECYRESYLYDNEGNSKVQ